MIEYESLYKANAPFMDEYMLAFHNALQVGWFVLGENVSSFEKEFIQYHQLNGFIGVASGMDALVFSLILSDLPKGSEVIVPSNTYIATILAILRLDLKPVLVEPDIGTYNIDPKRIEESITKNTSAIIVVHLYGRPCQMDPIMKIKDKYKLKLIEDCAQAHGAKYNGKMIGTFGEFAAFSFYPTKNLGALGDAGGLAFKDLGMSDQIKMLRNYGSKEKYVFDIIGHNSRLDEIQAAFLRIKLKRIDQINLIKNQHAKIYYSELSNKFILPKIESEVSHVYHIFNIRHDNRDKLRSHLLSRGIKTEVHYPIPPHKQKALAGRVTGTYPISEKIHDTTLSLPISWYHSEADIMTVVKALKEF